MGAESFAARAARELRATGEQPRKRAARPADALTARELHIARLVAAGATSKGDRRPPVAHHWLRHTTLTWVERHYGYGIARAYAGHTDSTGAATTTYIKADLQAVATALSAMTGHTHPLARP